MDSFTPLFEAIERNATAALLVLSLLALAWLFRDMRQRDEKHAAAIQAAHEAHLATAMQVIPLATKLATCVEVLERVTARVGGA